MSKTRGIV